MKSISILVTVLLLAQAFAQYKQMIDISEEINDPECFTKDKDVIVLRAFDSVGRVDPNLAKNIAKLANYTRELWVYMLPCYSCGNPQKQVQAVLDAIKNVRVDFVYIEVQGSKWDKDHAKNRGFVKAIADVIRPLSSKRAGIFTSQPHWKHIMGLDCSEFNDLHLWYEHADGSIEHKDFLPFGGWKVPTAKQYTQGKEYCNNTARFDSVKTA